MTDHSNMNGRNESPQEKRLAPARGGRSDIALRPQQQVAPYFEDDLTHDRPHQSNVVQDLLHYFWILFRHRWLVLGITTISLCVGAGITLLSTPVYRAGTTIQIDRESAKIVNVGGEIQADQGNEAAFYSTQYQILQSRALAEQVVSGLSVDDLASFTRHNVLSPWRKLRQTLERLVSPGGAAQAEGDIDVSILRRIAAYKVMGGLSVQPVGNSRVIVLAFEFPDPTWAQRIANAVADTFVRLTLERRFDATSYARSFLEERLSELKVKLEDSEAQVVRYAQEQKIVNVDDRRSLVSENLGVLNNQLGEAKRQRIQLGFLLAQAEASDGLSLPQILSDPSVQAKRQQRSGLLASYQDKLSFFKPDYPDMESLKAQIDELDRQIKEAVEIAKGSLKAEYETAGAQEGSLEQQLEETKTEALDLESRGIKYRILQREVDTNRQLYDGLLQRYKEVGVAGTVSTNNVSIVDAAEKPGGPFKPRLSTNLALFLGLGLVCGGLAAFGIEFLDDTFKIPEDVEGDLKLPVLGIIPVASTSMAFETALVEPKSSLSEAYRSLRTTLEFSTADGAPKTLLVTSSRPGEGKSSTALALARNFSQLGQGVLLIDADLRNPSLHTTLDLSPASGLSNYLTGSTLASGIFQSTDQEGMTFMACGPLPPNPAELLSGPRMASLLSVASEKFDIVVIDGPPVMGLADAPLLASVASGTLLVIEAGRTRRGITRAALKRLHFARAQMVGALINKFNARDVGHTYGYGYGYGYGESDYYGYGNNSVPKLEQAATKP